MPQFLVSWRLIGVETVEAESPEQARSMVEAMPGVPDGGEFEISSVETA